MRVYRVTGPVADSTVCSPSAWTRCQNASPLALPTSSRSAAWRQMFHESGCSRLASARCASPSAALPCRRSHTPNRKCACAQRDLRRDPRQRSARRVVGQAHVCRSAPSRAPHRDTPCAPPAAPPGAPVPACASCDPSGGNDRSNRRSPADARCGPPHRSIPPAARSPCRTGRRRDARYRSGTSTPPWPARSTDARARAPRLSSATATIMKFSRLQAVEQLLPHGQVKATASPGGPGTEEHLLAPQRRQRVRRAGEIGQREVRRHQPGERIVALRPRRRQAPRSRRPHRCTTGRPSSRQNAATSTRPSRTGNGTQRSSWHMPSGFSVQPVARSASSADSHSPFVAATVISPARSARLPSLPPLLPARRQTRSMPRSKDATRGDIHAEARGKDRLDHRRRQRHRRGRRTRAGRRGRHHRAHRPHAGEAGSVSPRASSSRAARPMCSRPN